MTEKPLTEYEVRQILKKVKEEDSPGCLCILFNFLLMQAVVVVCLVGLHRGVSEFLALKARVVQLEARVEALEGE